MRSRLRLWLGNLALLIAGTVFALVLAEVAIRLAGHRMVFPRMVIEDPHTVYRLKPNMQVRTIYRGYFDYEYTVNSQGFGAAADVVTPKPDLPNGFFSWGIRSPSAWEWTIQQHIRRESMPVFADGATPPSRSSTRALEDSVQATSFRFYSITDGDSTLTWSSSGS